MAIEEVSMKVIFRNISIAALGGYLLYATAAFLKSGGSDSAFIQLLGGVEQSAILGMYTGFFLLFVYVLQRPDSRIGKGLTLVFVGVTFSTYYPSYVLDTTPIHMVNHDFKSSLDLLQQMSLLAVAGAGGSLIATYADDYTEDKHQTSIERVVFDKTEEIRALRLDINKLRHTIVLCSIAIIVVIIVVSAI